MNRMPSNAWDFMYEKYGKQLNMTREQVYEMSLEELEYVSEIFNESND